MPLQFTTTIVTAVGLMGVGLVLAFFGYRLLRIFLVVVGFALGALGAAAGLSRLGLGPAWITLAGSLLCGVLGALLTFPLYLIGIFALGALAGGMVVDLLVTGTHPLYLIGGGLLGGILAAALQKPLIIVATAINGATISIMGVTALFQPLRWEQPGCLLPAGFPAPGHRAEFYWLAIAIVAAVAVAYQFNDARKHNKEPAGR